MNDIAACVLVREVEQMNRAGAVADVDSNVADLPETMGSLVKTEKLGDCCSGLGAKLARRDVRWKRRRAARIL